MTFKEFKDWCNQRTCDGCWSMQTAMYCIDLYAYIDSFAPWKKEKIWKAEYEDKVVNEIVNVINAKIDKYLTFE